MRLVPINFLFVAIEQSFMAYFFTKEEVFSASVDSCRTLQDAEKKLETALYDVYFIDMGAAPVLELLTFIEAVRKKSPKGIIILIATSEEECITKLLKEGVINSILLKPLAPQAVDEVFTGLLSSYGKADSKLDLDSIHSLPIVYVIDPDQSFLDLLNKVKHNFPFDLKTVSDPKEAIKFLSVKDFNPQAIIVAESFPGYSITGFEIIEEARKEGRSSFISALILGQGNEKGNIESRVKAMEMQINYVFHKPIYAYTFLQSVKDALEVQLRLNFKVLILDDDEDFCRFAADILMDAGIEVRAIYTAEDLFRTLDEYKPHLLLLDLRLPRYDGLNLLKTLRLDTTYGNLHIVIITGADETSTNLSGYSAKADEIIYKPIDPILFQRRILNFAERKKAQEENRDDTGMGSLKKLTADIHRCIENEALGASTLVLFEVNQLNTWVQGHGVRKGQELLVSIGNELLLQVDEDVLCFNYDTSKYALIFEKSTPEDISTKMELLLIDLAKRESLSDVGFNCSVIEISKKFGNAEQNLKECESVLQEARLQDTSPVKMKVVAPKFEGKAKKEVVLIDDDQQLIKILKRNFESYGIEVSAFLDGHSALNNLINRSDRELPSLIILERKLEGMDGIDIMIKLKEHFKHPIPFYILTFFGSDKDVIEGIKEGAIEYMTKPFNTSILMEKALKTIDLSS
jgi:DNA-binding response OmpR family regulator